MRSILDQSASTTVALAIPPPSHMVCRQLLRGPALLIDGNGALHRHKFLIILKIALEL
jgi:hypothetical protein